MLPAFRSWVPPEDGKGDKTDEHLLAGRGALRFYGLRVLACEFSLLKGRQVKSQWRKYPTALSQTSSIATIAPKSGLDGKSDAGAARVSCSGSKDGLTASSVIS